MGRLSDDGQWWWDGNTWIAIVQVELPQLPMTQFEKSGKLSDAVREMNKSQWLQAAGELGFAAVVFAPFLSSRQRAWTAYRTWKLEQVALATTYLLGPDEPMLAGEVALFMYFVPRDHVWRDLAVAVTAAHVVVIRFDGPEGDPRWIALARRAADATLEVRTDLFGLRPALVISDANAQWKIRGHPGVFAPQPVIDAWHKAIEASAHTQ